MFRPVESGKTRRLVGSYRKSDQAMTFIAWMGNRNGATGSHEATARHRDPPDVDPPVASNTACNDFTRK